MSERRKARPATKVAHLGRDPQKHLGAVNTPVYRASTMLFDSVADLESAERGEYPGISYGLHGLPTVTDLQSAVAALEGGHAALAVPSGLAAITLALLAVTKAGDHVLVPDSVYGPTRRFCNRQLTRFGVAVSYYDPLIGGAIEREMRDTTEVVFVESPGSLSFEFRTCLRSPPLRCTQRAGCNRQHVGHTAGVCCLGPRRRHFTPCLHQISVRTFGRDERGHRLQRGDLPEAAQAVDRHGRDR
jgi:hypothetical protein